MASGISNLKALLVKYLGETRVMQLSTAVNNQPWTCNVHFFADDKFNLYWISTPSRRHSEEIAQNQKVAAAILVHEDTPTEKYIIGISVEGMARLATSQEQIEKAYARKLAKPPALMDDIREGRNPHKFYKLTPARIVLFDTKNFKDNPHQELVLNNG